MMSDRLPDIVDESELFYDSEEFDYIDDIMFRRRHGYGYYSYDSDSDD